MKIKLTSVMVTDQEKALKFYTHVLGFVKRTEVPIGEFKWLTVISPEGHDDVELLLEPMGFPDPKYRLLSILSVPIPTSARTTKLYI